MAKKETKKKETVEKESGNTIEETNEVVNMPDVSSDTVTADLKEIPTRIDITKEVAYYVRLSNIEKVYNYYDNLLRSLEGNYQYFNDEESLKHDKEFYRKECLRLNSLKNKLIKEMNEFYKNI